ncbi:MAG: NHL repeat-containing protein [Candidatus Aminicenantales bacterium]
MDRRAKFACLSLVVFSCAVLPACRDRLFDNPFDPDAGEAVFEVTQTLTAPVGSPLGLTWDGSLLWTVDGSSDTIVGLNPGSGAVVRTLSSPLSGTADAAFDGADLWICGEGSADVYRINGLNGDIQKRLSLQRGSFTACEYAQGSLWLADALSNKILRVDPETAEVLGAFSNPGTRAAGLAFDGLHFWISDPATISIYELDSAGGLARTYLSPGPSPQGLAWDGLSLWNADGSLRLYQLRFAS